MAAARIFVREPDLLIFDDLSSALDVETEQQFWECLFAKQDYTCLLVSHRQLAFQHAHRIIVLKDGQIAAEGTLSDLALVERRNAPAIRRENMNDTDGKRE